ncbi:hypothetical protein WIW50_05235 [Flavobacteriaceae bacterium 3-367]|uniref:hypothetical protein n=1 Tax=Eudoraea algarum TaxID=3417568 RepID=UPI0032749341
MSLRDVSPIFVCILFFGHLSFGQIDSTLLKRRPVDTLQQTLNMDAPYNRPFLDVGKLPVSLGGYMEVNWQRLGTDGVSEGHQFQARRLTLFVASTISRRLKFLTEVEFEEGGREVAIEFASLDLEFHPLLNLRGGIILNPIGAFNQNHDGPKWEFTDRPISATQLLPATWSTPGFGLYGKYHSEAWMFGYEAYVTGGFDDSIIDNPENRTFLPASKENAERFEEGNTLFTGKIALRNNAIGEVGLSYMGGTYNTFEADGIVLDEKRRLNVFAIDFNTTLPRLNTFITGEWTFIDVDVPDTFTQQFGDKQHGGFMDIVQPILKKKIFGWEKAVVNLALRLEYVDWNVGSFDETGGNIAQDIWNIMPAISFRPTPQTVIRLNYRHSEERDLLGNPPAVTGGFIFGLSTYF